LKRKGNLKRKIKIRYVAVLAVLAVLLFMNYGASLVPGLGARFMIVASGSMSPFLNTGDIVVMAGVTPADIKVGDVIAFNVAPRFQQQYNYPQVVTHRVVEVVTVGSDLYFQTKGDATEKDPFTVPAADVIGAYSWKIPYVGIPLLFMRTVYGMGLIASYIIMDITLDHGPAWWKKRQKKEKLMFKMMKETKGIRKAVENLSNSTAPAHRILLKRKESGKVEVAETNKPAGLTVRRRA